MDKRFGYYIFGGALIGAFLGLGWAGSGNPLAGFAGGALVGAFIGWFVAAAVLENEKKKKENK